MKKAAVVFIAVLFAALAIFSISGTAQTTGDYVKNDRMYFDISVSISSGIGSDLAISQNEHAKPHVLEATEVDADDVIEDGINTRVATIWIVCISAVCFTAILIGVFILAKKNKA